MENVIEDIMDMLYSLHYINAPTVLFHLLLFYEVHIIVMLFLKQFLHGVREDNLSCNFAN